MIGLRNSWRSMSATKVPELNSMRLGFDGNAFQYPDQKCAGYTDVASGVSRTKFGISACPSIAVNAMCRNLLLISHLAVSTSTMRARL